MYLLTFFFNDTATTEIYTLSLHDALPISAGCASRAPPAAAGPARRAPRRSPDRSCSRSEEHTSELQSLAYLVCRLLLEKKNSSSASPSSSSLVPHPLVRSLSTSPGSLARS